MSLPPVFQLAMTVYGVDAEADDARRTIWVLLEPRIEDVVDRHIALVSANTPLYRELLRANASQYRALILEYTRKLFTEPFDDRWVADTRERVAREIELGHDMRLRGVIARSLLSAIHEIVRSQRKIAKDEASRITDLAARVLMLDVANAVSIHYAVKVREARAQGNELARAIGDFRSSIERVRHTVAAAINSLEENSQALAALARISSEHASTASRTAEQAASSVTVMAAATEELTGSISEVLRQTRLTAEMAHNAAASSEGVNDTIKSLSDAVQTIGSVADLISQIAKKTNLLALNAAIEAAGAGQAGKGFAVVAAEVKSLAKQTADATQGIARQIAFLREATRDSVDEIKEAGVRITEISRLTDGMMRSVDQQANAVSSIAQGVGASAHQASAVTDLVRSVEDGIRQTQDMSQTSLTFSRELSARVNDIGEAANTLFGVVLRQQGAGRLTDLLGSRQPGEAVADRP